jgi:hypothetical protein
MFGYICPFRNIKDGQPGTETAPSTQKNADLKFQEPQEGVFRIHPTENRWSEKWIAFSEPKFICVKSMPATRAHPGLGAGPNKLYCR